MSLQPKLLATQLELMTIVDRMDHSGGTLIQDLVSSLPKLTAFGPDLGCFGPAPGRGGQVVGPPKWPKMIVFHCGCEQGQTKGELLA